MAPHYPRPSDTLSPFRSRPEMTLHPLSPLRQPTAQPVLMPLINAAALISVIIAWPAGKAIAAVVNWLN